MRKILLTGVNGQVGNALEQRLSDEYHLTALSREQLDLTREDEIRRVVQLIKPDVIINPAAYTAVDKAESEQDLAYAINATAPQVLAEEALKLNAGLIHFSTDYVFDGTKSEPYVETDQVNPLGVYGKTKLAGEQLITEVGLPHLILRTSWVYGAYGKNFLKTILRLGSERDQLRIVADQFGAPTSSISIAAGVQQLLKVWHKNNNVQSGIYHFTNAGSTSWHGFTCQIIQDYQQHAIAAGMPALKLKLENIEPITTAEYPTPAKRPANSRLNNAKLESTFNITLPAWQDGLREVIALLER
ncbi:MAG TPA: dTDP-4-dehydrorhamnose reductase [Methylophilaceae bacterium]|nr:dTDP-4-dehydrorhamnose reductase [Methylophilaceae bacterium]HAJ70717.1 dTDP-4-dehydrorhamnose reductase [Methylophilaceae bacterium]